MNKAFLLLFTAIFVFAACEGPEGPPGRDGNGMDWKILSFDVKEGDWQLRYGGANNTNPYYVYERRAPQITEDIYEDGNVDGYVFLYDGNGKESQTPLPFVLPAENETGSIYDWIEITQFEYEIGLVRFIVTYSDFDTRFAPGDMHFRVVLTLY